MKNSPRKPTVVRSGASVPWRVTETVTGLLVRVLLLADEFVLYVLPRRKNKRGSRSRS
ncbi:hypothetical protein GCM10009738_76950 [Kitasatospora viridis]